MRRSPLVAFAVLAASALLAGSTVKATVLVDQTDALSTGSPLTPTATSLVYDDFKIATAGSLQSVLIYGDEHNFVASPSGAIVTIRSNSPSADPGFFWDTPTTGAGGVVYQQTVSAGNWQAVDVTTDGFGSRKGTFSATLPVPFDFSAGTKYWISVLPTFTVGGGPASSSFSWFMRGPDSGPSPAPYQTLPGTTAASTIDSNNTALSSYRVWTPDFFNGDHWTYSAGTIKPEAGTFYDMDMFMQLNGTTTAPEPTGLVAIGAGAFGLLARRRRRHA